LAKVLLSDLTSIDQTAPAAINANSDAIEEAMEKTLSRDGTAPNAMEADFDMNGFRLYNLPFPSSDTEPLRRSDFANLLDSDDNEILVSPYIETLLDDADASAARATLSSTITTLTGNTTVGISDWGKTLKLNGYFTLSLTSSAVLGSGFYFFVRNIGTRRVLIDPAGSETIDGSTTLGLYPGQSCHIFCDGSNFFTEGLSPRWRLTATTTLYASTTGSAANDGLDASAPLTPQLAQAFIRANIDQNSNNLIIQLADGTYNTAAGFSQFSGHWHGHHNIEIWGNQSSPGNVILAPTNSGENALYVTDFARVVARYIKFAGHASANLIVVEQHATIGLDTCELAGCNVAIRASINGNFKTNGVVTFSGTQATALQSTDEGMIEIGASSHVIANSPYISTTFAVATNGSIVIDPGASFGGAGFAGATGQRYLENPGGTINGMTSSTFFPGNAVGISYKHSKPNAARFINTLDNASVEAASIEGDRATPADADEATLALRLSDDAGNQAIFGRVKWIAVDHNVGTGLDGSLLLGIMDNGTVTDYLRIDSTIVSPANDGNSSLGSNTRKWSSLDISNAGFIRFNGSGNYTITHSTGLLTFSHGVSRGSPVTKTADFTLATNENWIINNKAGSACVVTLPAASSFPGREVMMKTIQAQAINSNASNVVPLAGGAAGTAIVTGTAGRWATLVSDGTNWVIMAGVI
jgi:hypothetical protein